MNFTQDDLKSLEKAIVGGTLTVRYSDKNITYRSLDEMMRIRDLVRNELGLTTRKNRRIFSEFDAAKQS